MKIADGYRPIIVQIEKSDYKRLKQLSLLSGYTMSDIVRNALKSALNRE